MNETKFTPGPWVIYPETDGTEICAVDYTPGLPIRQIIARPDRGANWISNAHLIAAAPELYEALESIAIFGSDTLSGRADGGVDDRSWQREAVREMTKRARAALAKARGEG